MILSKQFHFKSLCWHHPPQANIGKPLKSILRSLILWLTIAARFSLLRSSFPSAYACKGDGENWLNVFYITIVFTCVILIAVQCTVCFIYFSFAALVIFWYWKRFDNHYAPLQTLPADAEMVGAFWMFTMFSLRACSVVYFQLTSFWTPGLPEGVPSNRSCQLVRWSAFGLSLNVSETALRTF